MIAAKMSSKGQIVIPKKIRGRLNIKQGTFLKFEIHKGRILLTPVKKGPVEQLYGKFNNTAVLENLEREHADEIRRENRF